QAGHDLAGRERLDLEPVVGRFGNRLGKQLRRTPQGVERLREARGEAPFQLRRRLRNGGRGNGSRGQAATRGLEEVTTFHDVTCSVASPREAGSPPPAF